MSEVSDGIDFVFPIVFVKSTERDLRADVEIEHLIASAGVAGGAAGEAEPDVSVSFPIGVDLRLDGFGDAVDDAEQPGLGGMRAEGVFMNVHNGISIHIRFAGPFLGGAGGGLDGHKVVKAVGDDGSSGNFDVIDIKCFVDERGGHGANNA